jgi:hypothetical protein
MHDLQRDRPHDEVAAPAAAKDALERWISEHPQAPMSRADSNGDSNSSRERQAAATDNNTGRANIQRRLRMYPV